MKKVLLTLLIMSSPAFAFQDYLIISKQPVKSVSVSDPEILDITPLYTIDNQKKVLILNPKQIGKTKIKVTRFGSERYINVKVSDEKTDIKHRIGDFHCFILDTPPEKMEVLPPPVHKGAK